MLKFIFGAPSSGKTYTVLKLIKKYTEENRPSVLIVPEQFTFEAERLVLHTLGDGAASGVKVLSFTRLCDEVARHTGGLAVDALGECDRIIFMKRALEAASPELCLWKSYTGSVSFAKSMLDTVGELKINSVTPAALREAAENAETQRLKYKLNDIALIYETYDMLVGEKFADPADELTRLYDRLGSFPYFKDKTVFFDSFKGFTGQQYKITDRIFSQAEDIYISLTNTPECNREFDIYTNIRMAAERLKRAAAAYGHKILPYINAGESRYNSSLLKAMEAGLSGKSLSKAENDGGIVICRAATPFDEADFAARTVKRLVREEGYRYGDFVIIARDADSFKDGVWAACKKNGVKLFFDNRLPLSAFPPVRAVTAAAEALSFSTEALLKFHKTGLGTLATEEISRLENYAYLWGIDGKAWLNDFTASPDGLNSEAGEYFSDCSEELKELNELRGRATEPIIAFKRGFSGTARDMARAAVELLDSCNASEKLREMSRNLSDGIGFNADYLKQAYAEFMKILDSLARGFGNGNISQKEFLEALSLAVSLSDIGSAPQTLDEVTFGSADKIRPSRPKIAFILGANRGIFPKAVTNAGLFSLNERRSLNEYGIELADNSVYSAIDEEYSVYCSLCCPSDRLYVSYSVQGASGEGLEPSVFIDMLKNELGCEQIDEPADKLGEKSLPEALPAALSEYYRRLSYDKNGAETLKKYLCEHEGFDLKGVSVPYDGVNLKPENAQGLFGKHIKMSASKFESFSRCGFSYFCRYGLKAVKLRPADFDAMQRGTLVHYVMQRLITELGEITEPPTREKTDSLTDIYIKEYLDGISGYRSIENAKMKLAVSRISRSLKEVAAHICAELAQSDFKPVACELKIGKGCDVNEVVFPFDGGDISLSGSIDRVDEYDGYIRVIDYKTSSKSFKLPDILFGLNLQMLIYLYAVTRGQNLPDGIAAGILYQPSKRDLSGKGMAMNGLLRSDRELVSAMDKGLSGKYVPKLSFNKDGSVGKRSASFISEDEFGKIFDHIERLMKRTGKEILSGDISVSPVDGRESRACKYCDYASICGIEGREGFKVPELANERVFELIEEDVTNGI